MRLRSRGASLVELLMSLLMTIIIAGALFAVFTNTYASRDFAVGQGSAETDARTPLDNLADHLRDAQQYWITGSWNISPTSVGQSSTIKAGSANSLTYYKTSPDVDSSPNAVNVVTLFLNGTNLQRTADGATTTVMSNVQSLTFTYWVVPADASGNCNYNNGALPNTDKFSSLTAAQLPYVVQVDIDALVNDSGYQRELACTVRLRNSPFKLHL